MLDQTKGSFWIYDCFAQIRQKNLFQIQKYHKNLFFVKENLKITAVKYKYLQDHKIHKLALSK
jgi:hypothetical protein